MSQIQIETLCLEQAALDEMRSVSGSQGFPSGPWNTIPRTFNNGSFVPPGEDLLRINPNVYFDNFQGRILTDLNYLA
jgi:hypothetical protein